MQVFTALMALLGIFAMLTYYFTFWTAFGAVYLAGLLIVAVVASWGRRRQSGYWKPASEEEAG